LSPTSDARAYFERLARKWHEVPASRLDRTSTRNLVAATDDALLAAWERARADTSDGLRGLQLRGWFHALYGPWAAGKKILEVGPGLGIDGVALARAGAAMTFIDVSPTNLDVVSRVFALKGLARPHVLHLEHVEQLDVLDTDYDAVVAFGSLHHIPAEIGKPEFEALGRRLQPGGRFIMHAYPYQRWIDEGRLPFDRWGEKTDGAGTPWAEWYDSAKLVDRLRPMEFAPLLYCEYRNGAMNCIDLIKVDGCPDLQRPDVSAGSSPIAGAVDLGALAVTPGWEATATADATGSVLVTTPAASWAYAAAVPIRMDRVPPGHDRCALRVRATVRTGRVGFGIPTADGTAFVVEEYLARGDREQICWLEFERGAGPAQLVIVRNASSSGARSEVVVHAIECFTP
jgi:2-polyprenyl-3-methyl-5-hydroxy-6-metoxy-1,4-benzoquinol methylase